MYYYNPPVPTWQTLYTVYHFGILLFVYFEVLVRHQLVSSVDLSVAIAWLILSITSFGFLLENRSFALPLELFRCLLFFAFEPLMGSIAYPNPSTADYFKPLEFVQVYFPYQFLFNLILVLSHGISSVLLLFIVIHNIIENALTNKDYFWKRLNKLPDYFLFRKTKVNYTDA